MKKPRLKPSLNRIPRPKPGSLRAPKALALRRRTKNTEQRVAEALSNVPRITNETVAEHREDVLRSARKYIYPLQHSTHRIVRISISLLVLAVILFFAYCGVALYKFQSTNGFIYDVTRVIPLPVAKVGPRWVSYESYLFELRRNMHYYHTQSQINFATKDGKVQLKELKQKALDRVILDARVKQLAEKNNVSVTDAQVNALVATVRTQNRLGSNERVFKNVLNQYWGWNEADFKRRLRSELLQQAVVTKLDTATSARAAGVLSQLTAGSDFAALATASSDDASTKITGGQYPAAITQTNRDIAPQVTAEIFRLQPGQTSQIINTGYTLELLKALDHSGNAAHAAHIQFNLQPITTYTKPLVASQPKRTLIKP